MDQVVDKIEMVNNISTEILANGLADSREEAVRMAESWLSNVMEDMAL